MKPINDPLHQLIRSLNKSEKRSFKIFASRHVLGEINNYVKLFDAIDKQKVFDEAAIIKKFSDEKFSNRLVVAKSYLYESILKCLSQFHAQQGVSNQIKEGLISVSFLYEKGLYMQSHKLLIKLKKQAMQYQQLHLIPEIVNWERKILEATHFSDVQAGEVEALIRDTKSTLQQLTHINSYWELQSQLYQQHNQKGIARNDADLDQLSVIFDSPLMKNEEEADSFEAKLLHNKIFATYFFVIRDFESSYRYTKLMLATIESEPDIIKAEPRHYINTIFNFLNLADVLKKYDEHDLYLHKLHAMQLDNTSDTLEIQVFEGFSYHSLKYILSKKHSKPIQDTLNIIIEGLTKYQLKLNKVSEQMLIFHIFKVLYETNQKNESLIWLNKICSYDYQKARNDIYLFSTIIKLLVGLELKTDIAKSIVHCYTTLINQKKLNNVEQLVLSLIQSWRHERKDFKHYLAQASRQFETAISNSFERKALSYFDFNEWLDYMQPNIKSKKQPITSK